MLEKASLEEALDGGQQGDSQTAREAWIRAEAIARELAATSPK